jgi:hypothetical protein
MYNKSRPVRCLEATDIGKIDGLQFPPLRAHIVTRKISVVAYLAVQREPLEAGIMNRRRLTTVAAALCPTVVLAGWVVAGLGGFGSANIENSGATPVEDRQALAPSVDAGLIESPQATAMSNAAVSRSDVAAASEALTATKTTATSDEPESIGEGPSTELRETPPLPTLPVQVATASTADPVPVPDNRRKVLGSIEIFDECLAVDVCIDRYLWALYQRTPKEDSIKVEEQRKVTVKRKGKMVTVTRSFTRLMDEDFGWKDPKAADKVGMPMMDYVIGGMDRSFKLKLFHTLHAAEQAGLSPGITSAFRDDYRQSIASGLKAASNRSYHGGSLRGGYGHGLAADIVSVKGETRDQRYLSSENLWKWIDAHGKEFGIGRPYTDRDPPHVAPIDGNEYASHHGVTKAHHAGSEKKHKHLAARDDHRAAKRAKTAKSSRVRTT